EAPRTVIHGEYFGLNIIYQNGTSWPADWQSAAIAPGEIDLASLTHSWPRPLVRKCEREYRRSRWPDGAPDDFPEILEAARAYMNFRWLGDPGPGRAVGILKGVDGLVMSPEGAPLLQTQTLERHDEPCQVPSRVGHVILVQVDHHRTPSAQNHVLRHVTAVPRTRFEAAGRR